MVDYSSIAIVIPSLGRHDFLVRTIQYYSGLNLSLNLFIGDSSPEPLALPGPLVDSLSRSNLNYFYFHLPGLNDRQAISYLVDEVCGHEIEFISFHGDDDYFVPEALLDCSSFLSRNLDYTSAQGSACTISLNQAGPYGALKTIFPYWHSPSLHAQSCEQRLYDFADSYFVLQFSVHRTPEFLESCLHYKEVPDRYWGELYHCFYFALQGKSYFLNRLMLVRQSHPAISHDSFASWVTSLSFSRGFVFVVEKLFSVFHDSFHSKDLLSRAIERQLYLTLRKKSVRSVPATFLRLFLSRSSALCLRLLFFADRYLFPIPCSKDSFFYYFRRVIFSLSSPID